MLLAPILLLACAPVPTATPPAPEAPAPPPRAQARLLVHVLPDGGVLVGTRYTLPPGWHIYWTNPGDTGLATRATLRTPEGFAQEGPLYPGPERFVSPGDIVSYGYSGEATLLWRVQAPAGWTQAALQVETRWLLCKDICVPDEATLTLEATPQTLEPTLVDALGLTPFPWSSAPGATLRAEGGSLLVQVPGARKLELFPSSELALALGAVVVEADADGEPRLRLNPRPGDDLPSMTAADPGVLVVHTGRAVRQTLQLPPLPLEPSE